MLEYTVLCIVLSVVIWPMLSSGRHFHLAAFIFALYPISWGFIMLVIARRRSEIVIGLIAAVFSILSILVEVEGNTRWLFSSGIWHWQ